MEFGMEYIKNFNARIEMEKGVFQSVVEHMKTQRKYVRISYGEELRNVAVVGHAENIHAWFGKSMKNGEVFAVSYQ